MRRLNALLKLKIKCEFPGTLRFKYYTGKRKVNSQPDQNQRKIKAFY